MTSTMTYIKEWQQALRKEIQYLKKYGSNKWFISNGRLLGYESSFHYYFDTQGKMKIPVGSMVRLVWGGINHTGRVLSSEGNGMLLSFEQSFGDLVPEAYLFHDPWELLEQLIERLDEIKKNKVKRLRIKRLMDPSEKAKHPVAKIKSNLHELVLRSKYNPVTFVWGPPGTGKTYTLARVAANKYFQEKRVLILAHSNQAVDVLVNEVGSFLKKKGRFSKGALLRYGSLASDLLKHNGITTNQLLAQQEPGLIRKFENLLEERQELKNDLYHSFNKRDSTLLFQLEGKISKILEKIRQKEIQFVKEAFMVGTTLAKAASDSSIYERKFDVVMIDEASMAYVPYIAFAATLGKRIIICGDFKQLPPIASSKDSLVTTWLREDIFHRVGIAELVKKGIFHPHLFLLKEQRRMHPDISAFTNQTIYHSLVKNHESVLKNRNQIVEKAPFPNQAAVMVDASHTGMYCINERTTTSRFNLWQLLLSFQLIHESYVGGARSIGYVTPYRAQANLMEMLLNELYQKECGTANIIAATVHRFQGSEQDVMIFDTVDSFPQERAGMLLSGKNSERLINVAITRTKGKFIHVSDQSFIRKHVFRDQTLHQLVNYQEKHQQTFKTKDIGTWIRNQHPKLNWMHARKLEKIFYDITFARSSILIFLPDLIYLSDQWKALLKQKNRKAKLSICFGDNQSMSMRVPFPFVIIDHHLLWLGQPLEGVRGAQPPFVAVRLDSEKIVEHFLKEIFKKE